MDQKNKYKYSKNRLSIIMLLGIIFAFLGLNFAVNNLATKNGDLLMHSLDVKTAISSILTSMVDAETGQRGYVITAKQEFLEPYEKVQTNFIREITALKNLVADNNKQLERVEQLNSLWEAKSAELAKTIALVKNNKNADAFALVADGKGKQLMDEIRSLVSEFQSEQSLILNVQSKHVETLRRCRTALLLLGIAALTILSWLEMRRFKRQNIELLESNRDLDLMVQERTKELQQEKQRVEILLQDVTHRIGNNLAMVSALLGLQAHKSKNAEVKTALFSARTRIAAIATGQRRLQLDLETDEVLAKPYLENLLQETVQSASERGIALHYEIDNIKLPGKDAVSYIVLTNELVTNALKHAFPEGQTGEVHVNLGLKTSGEQQVIELRVEDNGVGSVNSAPKTGLGHTIIKSLLTSMDATLQTEIRWPHLDRKGYRSTIYIPVSNAAHS